MVIQGSQEVNTVFDQAQLRKGTLEGCILQIISREPTYGYAIAATLRDSGFADLTEGHALSPCCCGWSAAACWPPSTAQAPAGRAANITG